MQQSGTHRVLLYLVLEFAELLLLVLLAGSREMGGHARRTVECLADRARHMGDEVAAVDTSLDVEATSATLTQRTERGLVNAHFGTRGTFGSR